MLIIWAKLIGFLLFILSWSLFLLQYFIILWIIGKPFFKALFVLIIYVKGFHMNYNFSERILKIHSKIDWLFFYYLLRGKVGITSTMKSTQKTFQSWKSIKLLEIYFDRNIYTYICNDKIRKWVILLLFLNFKSQIDLMKHLGVRNILFLYRV